jgi:uncharacterized protein (UPF0276 family)
MKPKEPPNMSMTKTTLTSLALAGAFTAVMANLPIPVSAQGHVVDRDDDDAPLLIGSHTKEIAEVVWTLFQRTIARIHPITTLIEWDNNVPEFVRLAAETDRARTIFAARPRVGRVTT